MHLAGAARPALDVFPFDHAADHADGAGALAECEEVDVERAVAVGGAERVESVADAREEDREFGLRGDLVSGFELGGGDEVEGKAVDGSGGGFKRDDTFGFIDGGELGASASDADATGGHH